MWAEPFLQFVLLYLAVGGLFGLVFVTVLVGRIDEGARGSYPFRLLILPAAVLLWPWIAFVTLRKLRGAR
jgi:hypothetical protein